MNNLGKTVLGAALAAAFMSGSALAQQAAGGKLKLGLKGPLSGPAAVLGEQGRDGFQLAVEELGKKLGGLDAEVIVVDDENKPDVAVNKAKELV
jgi:branched-chain amino acid transport system substrate-binding protein